MLWVAPWPCPARLSLHHVYFVGTCCRSSLWVLQLLVVWYTCTLTVLSRGGEMQKSIMKGRERLLQKQDT